MNKKFLIIIFAIIFFGLTIVSAEEDTFKKITDSNGTIFILNTQIVGENALSGNIVATIPAGYFVELSSNYLNISGENLGDINIDSEYFPQIYFTGLANFTIDDFYLNEVKNIIIIPGNINLNKYHENTLSVSKENDSFILKSKGEINMIDLNNVIKYYSSSPEVIIEYNSSSSNVRVMNGDAFVTNGKQEVVVNNELFLNNSNFEFFGPYNSFSVEYSKNGKIFDNILISYLEDSNHRKQIMASFSRTSSNTRGKIFLFKTYEEELINRINWNIIADSESSDSYFYETEDELNYEQDNTSSLVYSLSFSLINYVKDFFSLDIGVSAEEDTTPIAPEEGYNETEAPHSFSYPGLEFQFTKCDLTIDPFNVSLLALQDVNWLDDSTLALKVNVALRSESTVLGASYRIINNTIALNYNSSMCLVCAQSYCVRSLYYTITGLENKNYSFFIERTEEDEIGSIEDGILAISAHMSRPITLSNLSANATRINSSLGPTNYYFDRAVMMRVIDGGDILQGSFLSGKELPVTFSSKNNYTKMDAGDNVSLFLNNGFLYFERRSGQNLPLLVESVGAGVILDNIYLISNKASGKVALSGQGLFKDFNGAAPMEFTPYVSKNRPHQTDNGVYYEPYFGYLFIDKNMTPAKIIISDNGDLYILNKDTPVDKNGNIINKKGKRHTGMAILTGNVINSFDSLKSKITGEVVDSEVVSDFDWDSIDNRWIEIVDKR